MSTLRMPLVCLLLSLPAVASASDTKNYPAVGFCHTSGGTASISSGRLLNSSTASTMSVYCPIMQDEGSGLDLSETYVHVLDRTSTGRVSCTQYSRYQDNTGMYGVSDSIDYPASAGDSTSYSSSDPLQLTGASGSGYPWGHVNPVWDYLLCTIPAASGGNSSGIFNYYVTEV